MSSTQQLILGEGAGGAPAGYQIERSLRFNSADTAYLNRTPASATNRKTFTWSGWVKRSVTGVGTNVFVAGPYVSSAFKNFRIRFTSGEALEVYNYDSSYQIQLISSAVYRDPSAWYHIVVAVDTTQATNTNRVKVYVNGVQVTAFGTATYPNQNVDTEINTTEAHYLGFKYSGDGDGWFSGYLTEVNFIDGQALTPSDFGETDSATGVWKPKAYTGTYGTNGFYVNFSDNSNTTSTTLGKDYSGNGNNWTPNNFSVTAGAGNDSLVDTPTPYGTDTGAGGEVRGNYCTLNPLNKSSVFTFANGNLDVTSTTGYGAGTGTIGMSSGKWYWEVTITTVGSEAIGIAKDPINLGQYGGQSATSWIYTNNGQKGNNDSFTSYGNTYTTGDVIGIGFNADDGELKFYKNGTVQNSGTAAFTGLTSGPYYPTINNNSAGGSTTSVTFNFGQRPFAYTAPSGFKALCTQNLPTPTIGATATTRADDYFNTVLYTGTGSSLGVTGVGFQPDFVWIKERAGAADHGLYDAVRGVQNQLESNTTTAETTETTGLTAFGTDGFTVGALAQLNTNTDTYVAWNWKANGAGVPNTAGSISSTVSANTTAGFSIVTYTGTGANATVGHGLGVAPSMVIVKSRNTAGTSWVVWQTTFTSTEYILLQSTDAKGSAASVWNSTIPSSTVFSVGTDNGVNGNTYTYVAYCFAPVAGYSAFGSFTGNGSTDGAFVYTGFRPAWVMMKVTSDIGAGGNWGMFDNDRLGYNPAQRDLRANLSNAEGTDDNLIDFLSNGFKIRSTSGGFGGGSGNTYIYAAFAEFPFKYTLAR